MSALFGALAIGLIYAMGRLMFNRWVGLLAAALLLLDGIWLVQARIAMNDVFLATFLMVAWFGLYLYLRGPADATRRYLWVVGAGLACAFATKWSAGYSVGLIGLTVVAREGWTLYKGRLRTPIWKVLLTLIGVFGLIPVVYLAAYTQFFTMGHTWSEWQELQKQMWWYHSRLEATHPWSSRWWSWPLMLVPVWYYADYAQGPNNIVSIYGMGNPLIFWAFLPALAFAAYSWVTGRFREVALAVILGGFLGQWLPWALSPRISFLYHITPCVPFGCLAIAYGLNQIRAPRVVAVGYLVPVVLAFIYFYPLFAGYPISQEYLEQHYWMQRWNPMRQ
jgi:dolichyl-phosphate-mannose-protein mannosyltransferase